MWLIHPCDMTYASTCRDYVRHDSFLHNDSVLHHDSFPHHDSFLHLQQIYVIWLIHPCDMTHASTCRDYVRHNSFVSSRRRGRGWVRAFLMKIGLFSKNGWTKRALLLQSFWQRSVYKNDSVVSLRRRGGGWVTASACSKWWFLEVCSWLLVINESWYIFLYFIYESCHAHQRVMSNTSRVMIHISLFLSLNLYVYKYVYVLLCLYVHVCVFLCWCVLIWLCAGAWDFVV